ncbi:hypothetical protein BJV78DRAFT_1262714 [Lactifluus subvellereus]|nr:hypothetical protein BJV78DRAFT_1262714 [Lactifluus subvellereus]
MSATSWTSAALLPVSTAFGEGDAPPLPPTQSLLSRVLPVFNDRTVTLDVISLHWHRLVSRPHPFASTNLASPNLESGYRPEYERGCMFFLLLSRY